MTDLLRALAEEDRPREAPRAVEQTLLAAFRKRYERRRSGWAIVAAASLAAGVAMFFVSIPKEESMTVRVAGLRVVEVPTPRHPEAVVAPREVQEVATPFYALMEDEPLGRAELIRTKVPASAMKAVGLPVADEHLNDLVPAEVLVGEEGLARAIRFIAEQ